MRLEKTIKNSPISVEGSIASFSTMRMNTNERKGVINTKFEMRAVFVLYSSAFCQKRKVRPISKIPTQMAAIVPNAITPALNNALPLISAYKTIRDVPIIKL